MKAMDAPDAVRFNRPGELNAWTAPDGSVWVSEDHWRKTRRASDYVMRDGVERGAVERPMTPIAERFHQLAQALQEAHGALTELADSVAPVARLPEPRPDQAAGAPVRRSMSMIHGQALDAVESVQDLTRRIRDLVERIEL